MPQGAVYGAAQVCSACQEDAPAYAKAIAYGAYDGELRELIHLLKYDRVAPASAVLGGMLAQALGKLNVAGPVVLVPVPLHSSKRRQRGFSQAELIVHAALKSLTEYETSVAPNALERVRPTMSQIGLTRPQRRDNLRGAFRVAHLSQVKGAKVVIVDDVLTTGVTASECAHVLRRAGAENVWVAIVARTLKNSSDPLPVDSAVPAEANA
jgi:ComF family protein